MPFSVGQSINEAGDYFLKSTTIRHILENPIYVALCITIILILIIIVVFRNAETDDPLFIMAIRTGFWVFIGGLACIFLHDKLLYADVKTGEFAEIFTDKNMISGKYDELIMPILN